MKHFTIDNDNNITLHPSRKVAQETGAGVFSTEEQFADLIGNDSAHPRHYAAARIEGYSPRSTGAGQFAGEFLEDMVG